MIHGLSHRVLICATNSRWEREGQMLEMRCRVLQNELVDVIQERQQFGGNIESAKVVLQMFLQEEKKARAKCARELAFSL